MRSLSYTVKILRALRSRAVCVFVFVFPSNTFSFVRVLSFPAKLDFHLASGVERFFFSLPAGCVKIDKSVLSFCLVEKVTNF